MRFFKFSNWLWTSRRSNQSILKEISLGCSLEGMMLKLKLQYFGHLIEELTHWKRLWRWEGLGAGGEGDDREWDGWMASLAGWHHWLDGRESKWTPGVGDGQGGLPCCNHGVAKSQTPVSDWTDLNWNIFIKDHRCSGWRSFFLTLSSVRQRNSSSNAETKMTWVKCQTL